MTNQIDDEMTGVRTGDTTDGTTDGILPVATRLVRSAITMLESHRAELMPVAEILERADASYADLYAEFGGIDGLIDAAHLSQVSSRSRESIELVASALNGARTYEEVLHQINQLTAFVRDPAYKHNRVMRTLVIGSTLHRPELAEALAQAQHELTNRFAEILTNGERRGLYRCVTSPRAIASFIQAFTAGQILDEIDHAHTSDEDWMVMVDQTVRSLLLPLSAESDPQ
jgi:AcrR family transcriptional regulator